MTTAPRIAILGHVGRDKSAVCAAILLALANKESLPTTPSSPTTQARTTDDNPDD